MSITLEHDLQIESTPAAATVVELADGTSVDLAGMTLPDLEQLQWEQEPAYAKAILATEKDSGHRAEVTATGYSTVCTILDRIQKLEQDPTSLKMGMDERYTNLVQRVAAIECEKGIAGWFVRDWLWKRYALEINQ